MLKQIETWKVIILEIQFWCIGGITFSKNETVKTILGFGVALCFFVILIFG